MVDLRVELTPRLSLRNPILSASGTFGHGLEMCRFVAPASLGALVSKTVTLHPRHGNPAPRICETEAGLLNSIGLENRGIESYLRETLLEMAGVDTRVITNIGGESRDEFLRLAELLEPRTEVDALELNLSCPNVQGGRLPFATDPQTAEATVRGVCEVSSKPILAKLSPNVTRIGEMAQAVEAGGAAAVVAVNTLLGLAVDWRSGAPGLAMVQGGYSGPGIKPVALRCAWECARSVEIPVIGCGGIGSAADVLEFVVAGCTAVQVGTASFSDPALLGRLADGVAGLLEQAGIGTLAELVGSIADGPIPGAGAPGAARPMAAPQRPAETPGP